MAFKKSVAFGALAGLFAASVLAGGPIRLTEAQMDEIVAGATFPYDSGTNYGTPVATYTYFHGWSQNEASGPGPGTSTYEVVTQTDTPWTQTMTCPGALSSCTTGGGGLNPNTVLNAKVYGTPVVTEISSGYTEGPGSSPLK